MIRDRIPATDDLRRKRRSGHREEKGTEECPLPSGFPDAFNLSSKSALGQGGHCGQGRRSEDMVRLERLEERDGREDDSQAGVPQLERDGQAIARPGLSQSAAGTEDEDAKN